MGIAEPVEARVATVARTNVAFILMDVECFGRERWSRQVVFGFMNWSVDEVFDDGNNLLDDMRVKSRVFIDLKRVQGAVEQTTRFFRYLNSLIPN